jgi:hypothetical protein
MLAAWGWPFPTHAINWGKYPALASIPAFEIVICGIYLTMQAKNRQRWLLVCLTSITMIISTFIHTRSLILISFAVLSILVAYAWSKLNQGIRIFIFFLTIAALAALIFITHTKPILNMAVEPYQAGGLWMTLLVLSLFPFAVKGFPRAAFAIVIFSLLTFGSLFISVVQFLPAYDVQTLLDRPYVEMIAFLPLTFLGGLGYAGMIKTLQNFDSLKAARQKWLNGILALLLFGAIGVNTSRYSFLPSECCNFFSRDDATALDWMDKNLPVNANTLIASAQSVVFENTLSAQYAGSDSGIWITPLIHRSSLPFPYGTDFSKQETFAELCKNGVTHIYIGGKGVHFNQAQLDSLPAWYENLLRLSKVQVYQLVGCP